MATRLPDGALAMVEIRKVKDYCLNPSHPRGRHKARVFQEILGLPRDGIGTVVEPLDDLTSLVEFSDDTGQAQAMAACAHRGHRVVSSAQV